MKQHAQLGGKKLRSGQVELYQQVFKGKPMGNPMALIGPKGSTVQTWEDLKPGVTAANNGESLANRFWAAVYRDACYCTAGSPWLRSFGMRQSAREITDFAIEQTKAGVKS